MSVWLTIPSARPVDDVAQLVASWQERGYRVALQRDERPREQASQEAAALGAEIVIFKPYAGYSQACNVLVERVLTDTADADWVICAGDDTLPDPHTRADAIVMECFEHFGGTTFGVMQPTGDRWGDTAYSRAKFGRDRGALIDRVAGSAWIGREFVQRTYGGRGPMWPEYFHMFNDLELQEVAEQLGVFWQRRDLTQLHNHCERQEFAGQPLAPPPEFMQRAYSKDNWTAMRAIYLARKAASFPGAFEGEAHA